MCYVFQCFSNFGGHRTFFLLYVLSFKILITILGNPSVPWNTIWKMLYKIIHFSHILYTTTTPNFACLQTNDEPSCPPIFAHSSPGLDPFKTWEILGQPSASSWNAISSLKLPPPFPFFRHNKLLFWKLLVPCRYFLYCISYCGSNLCVRQSA